MLKPVIPPSYGSPTAAPAAARLNWQEAFVIALALGLTIFLYVRDVPFAAAAATSAATMLLLVVAVVIVPRGIATFTRHQRFLRSAADELARLEQEGRR